jgi:hypothetical protein
VLEVSGHDQRLTGFGIELRTASGAWESLRTEGVPEAWPTTSFQRSILARIPAGLEGQQSLRLVVATTRIVNEAGGLGWIQATSTNNGALLGTAERNLRIVRQQTLETVEIDPALFSPLRGATSVRGNLREAARVTVRVYRQELLLRSVVDDASFGAGPFEIAWDGLDDLGQLVPDDEYRIEVRAVNGSGASSKREVEVEEDATAPPVAIESPSPLQPVSIAVEVLGTATDANLEFYRLEPPEGPLPEVATRVEHARLGTWRVGELTPGPQTLRLFAVDRAGNENSTSVVVDVVSPDLVARFGADPSVFSPNGDGVKDTTEISFRLKRESLVTLTIGSSVIFQETRAAGDHIYLWDGAVPDGDYIARLLAEDVVQEEAEVPLTVDRTSPSIEASAPSGFVSLPSSIFGTIHDENLERYRIEIGPESGTLSPLDEDSVPASGALATLVGLDDGRYRFSIRASDLAGNETELQRSFDVDSTPPIVEIRDLASHVSTAERPLVVKARLVEANLESYALEVGAGASPSVFVPLASGGSVTSPDLEASWDVTVLPDGVYTVRLRATDKAGSSSATSRQLVLDGTAPSVEIETPGEGAFASADSRVVGSAHDESFVEAVLSLARGDAPLQEIARFDAPVMGGVLKEGLAFEDGLYRLSLTAKDLAGNTSAVERTFHLDSEPPEAPAGVQAEIVDRASVRLTWTPSPESDVVGYRVYRDGVLLAEVTTSGGSRRSIPEGRYLYRVAARDRADLERACDRRSANRFDAAFRGPPLSRRRRAGAGTRGRRGLGVLRRGFPRVPAERSVRGGPGEPDASEKVAPSRELRDALPVGGGRLRRKLLPDSRGRGHVGERGDGSHPGRSRQHAAFRSRSFERFRRSLARGSRGRLGAVLGARRPRLSRVSKRRRRERSRGRLRRPPAVPPARTELRGPGPSRRALLLPHRRDGRGGNVSFDSNRLCVFLDNRSPAAILVEPENGARFDSPRALVAVTEDEDVSSGLFQYQATDASFWSDIASDSDRPYEALWDVTGLAFGNYRLRAVATDGGGRTDPAPAFITVVLADSTPPETPTNLLAAVDGDSVALTWDAVSDSGLAGYSLYRNDSLVRSLGISTTVVEAATPDGFHEYRLSARDAAGNESAKSESAEARVYQPVLLPVFPIFETDAVDLPGESATPEAQIELFLQGSSAVLAEATAGLDGRFVFEDLALPQGESLLEARATDLEGNRSRLSDTLFLFRNERPQAPAGLGGVVNGMEAALSWTANAESDLSGYVVRRDGEVLTPSGRIGSAVPATLAASASALNASRAIDSNPLTVWSSGAPPVWLEVSITPGSHVEEVRVFWGFAMAMDGRVLAEISGRLVPLASLRGNDESSSIFSFPLGVRTGRVRLEATPDPAFGFVQIREVELYGFAPSTSTSAADVPDSSGIYTYGVSAVDVFGSESAPSEVELAVGDVTAPDAPSGLAAAVSLSEVALSWAPSPSADVALYRIYRDGALAGEASGTSFTDPLLPDGLYRYEVAAVDGDGNESARSNEALADVSVDSPSAPVLSVSPVPEGRALALDWTPSTGPVGVAEYAVFRSTSAGGPYVDVHRTGDLGLVDRGLSNGIPYFYVVRALDPRGEASLDSNEASGTPGDEAPPEAPVFLRPTTSGAPITVTTTRTDLAGRAEPGSRVSVFRGVELAAEVAAVSTLADSRSFPVSAAGVRASGGMSLADVDSETIRVWNLETGALQTFAFDGGGSVNGVAFSPGGDRIAVAAGGALHLTGPTQSFDLGGWVSSTEWIAEGSIAAVVDGDIVLLDVSSGATEEIYSGVFFDPPRGLRRSPGGLRLAFIASGELVVLELATRASTVVASEGELAWTSDQEIVFAGFEGLRRADVVLGTSALVPGTEGARSPSLVSPSELIALSAAGEVILVGSEVAVLGPLPVQAFDVELFAAAADFRALVVDRGEGRAKLFSLPGRFEALQVSLVSGANEITAEAKDAAGNVSARSSAIEVVLDDSFLPDLVPFDFLVVPAVPASGDVVSLSVTVENRGLSESARASSRSLSATARETSSPSEARRSPRFPLQGRKWRRSPGRPLASRGRSRSRPKSIRSGSSTRRTSRTTRSRGA